MALLIAGGTDDTSLAALAAAAQRTGVPIVDLRLPANESLGFSWNVEEGRLRICDQDVDISSGFIRYDAFGPMFDRRPSVAARASGWHQTVIGWLLSDPSIRMFNRRISPVAGNKPAVLLAARRAGLRIPSTLITNEVARFEDNHIDSLVAKPVAGGDYCYPLYEALQKAEVRNGLTAVPAMVQPRLVAPEVRIYAVGSACFAFEVRSPSLDYRVKQDAELFLLPGEPPEIVELRKLMSVLGLDFGAADFKTDSATGELVFLELNTSPMFARFDDAAEGRLCEAMVDILAGPMAA